MSHTRDELSRSSSFSGRHQAVFIELAQVILNHTGPEPPIRPAQGGEAFNCTGAGSIIDDYPGSPRREELAAAGVDFVYGGPPCQGFSQIGPRDVNDPRNLLYKEFARVLSLIQPRCFVMENVPNIIAMRNG